jgi:cytoskeletal protein CcmA (bactofilin family)
MTEIMKKIIIFTIISFLLIPIAAAAAAAAKNIVKIGADLIIEKDQTVNNVVDIGGQVTVYGLIEGNVLAVGGSVVLSNNAVVRGNVVCVGGVIVKGSGAQVFGDITEINSANISTAVASVFRGEMEGWSLIFNIISLCFFAVIFIIALLMTILIPRPLTAIVHEIQSHKAKSFFWGFLATLTMVPFFMLLVISIIGITLIPLAFTMLLLALILGYIAAGTLIGNFIFIRIFRGRKKTLVGQTLLGLILLWLIGWIPYIGWIVKVFALTLGLGGVLLALFSRKERLVTPPQPLEEPLKPISE